MPRHQRKGVKGRQGETNSDDESFNDNVSVYSNMSDNAPSSSNDLDEFSLNERFEEKFTQALANATEKSAQTRILALQSISEMLMHRYIPDIVEDRKITLVDCIEKSIRRGKSIEQVCGARLVPLLVLQMRCDESIFKSLKQLLITAVQDKLLSYEGRAKCCLALGLLYLLGEEDTTEVLSLMQCFENIFSESYNECNDKTQISLNAEASAMYSEALYAWALMLTLLPAGTFISILKSDNNLPFIGKFSGLLQSSYLDVRVAAGEALALLFECGRSYEEDFLDEHLEDLIEIVKKLATDSHKYRAKRDRKIQRATFRDILRYLEEDTLPEINIRFGSNKEQLVLDTWAIHRQYSSLCSVMGPGMTCQLQENNLVRNIFQLGEKSGCVLSSTASQNKKMSKLERHLMNAAAFKARSISRGKNRDKRSAVFN